MRWTAHDARDSEHVDLELPPALYDIPTAQRARLLGLLEAEQAALHNATQLLGWGRPLLVAVIVVSFLHAWESVAAIRPAFVEPLLLPAAVYHVAAAAFTLAIDLVALYVIAAGQTVALAGMRATRWGAAFFLGVTLLLNAAFIVRHAPSLPETWRMLLLPGLEASFVVLLPSFVMLAILAVEGATHQLVQARLTLLAETRALAAIVATDVDVCDQLHDAPTLESDRSPATVRLDRSLSSANIQLPAAPPEPPQAHDASLPCPRCGAALTMGQYLAARREDGCATCRPRDGPA
jgi:hypothetical protein